MSTSLLVVRIDRWLVAARIYKTRTLAQLACGGGHVTVNGVVVKASHAIKRSDEVRADGPRGSLVLVVRDLADKRLSAPMAEQLYEDNSPPPPPKEEQIIVAERERGAGRPTKADRRALERLRS
jgi:ribosome-associated heat shock protein Hsp15